MGRVRLVWKVPDTLKARYCNFAHGPSGYMILPAPPVLFNASARLFYLCLKQGGSIRQWHAYHVLSYCLQSDQIKWTHGVLT